jgi:hypothetical protein
MHLGRAELQWSRAAYARIWAIVRCDADRGLTGAIGKSTMRSPLPVRPGGEAIVRWTTARFESSRACA